MDPEVAGIGDIQRAVGARRRRQRDVELARLLAARPEPKALLAVATEGDDFVIVVFNVAPIDDVDGFAVRACRDRDRMGEALVEGDRIPEAQT